MWPFRRRESLQRQLGELKADFGACYQEMEREHKSLHRRLQRAENRIASAATIAEATRDNLAGLVDSLRGVENVQAPLLIDAMRKSLAMFGHDLAKVYEILDGLGRVLRHSEDNAGCGDPEVPPAPRSSQAPAPPFIPRTMNRSRPKR